MDSQLDKTPGLALPQPSIEQGGSIFDAQQSGQPKPEIASATPEMASMPMQPSVTSAATTTAPVASVVPAALQPVQMSTAAASSAGADDDSDALDEEWVQKAKSIIERTKNDPFSESKELGKAKADYLRIRYNKQIKVVEDHER